MYYGPHETTSDCQLKTCVVVVYHIPIQLVTATHTNLRVILSPFSNYICPYFSIHPLKHTTAKTKIFRHQYWTLKTHATGPLLVADKATDSSVTIIVSWKYTQKCTYDVDFTLSCVRKGSPIPVRREKKSQECYFLYVCVHKCPHNTYTIFDSIRCIL